MLKLPICIRVSATGTGSPHVKNTEKCSYFASYQSLPIWQSVSSSTLSEAAALISSSRISLAFSASCRGASIRSSSWI